MFHLEKAFLPSGQKWQAAFYLVSCPQPIRHHQPPGSSKAPLLPYLEREPSCSIKEPLKEYLDILHRRLLSFSVPRENIQQGKGLIPGL